MISIGGAGERGTNGTLRPATALTRSGASTARFHTTIAPQSCPTKIARSSPSASSRPVRSPQRVTMS